MDSPAACEVEVACKQTEAERVRKRRWLILLYCLFFFLVGVSFIAWKWMLFWLILWIILTASLLYTAQNLVVSQLLVLTFVLILSLFALSNNALSRSAKQWIAAMVVVVALVSLFWIKSLYLVAAVIVFALCWIFYIAMLNVQPVS